MRINKFLRNAIMIAFTAISINTSGTELEKSPPSLRIISYNIRHGAGMDMKLDLKRIAKVIRKQNPDLVALQEVDKNCRRSGSQDIAAELGKLLGMDHRFGKFMDYGGGEYGMAVLSKLTITKTVRHQLPRGAEPRCALEIKVAVAGISQPLSFVCIHNDWTTEEIRVRQIETLLADIKDYKNPIILVGDFNGERTDASLQLLAKKEYKILDKKGAKTWPADKPQVEIDFFIFKNMPYKDVVHFVIDEREASDHRPIYAEITLDTEKKDTK